MSRWEFMSQLEKLLLYVPIQEREEALQYYNDYFDDAGPEREQEVIASLGSPKQVAENIKRDIHQSHYGAGPDRVEPGKEMIQYQPEYEIFEEPMKKGIGNSPEWVKIVILICAAPIILSLLGGIIGAVVGILGGIVSLLLAGFLSFGAIGIACPIAGVVLVILGIIMSVSNIYAGLCVIGLGLIFVAVGILGIWLEVMLVGKWLPVFVKVISKVFGGVVKKLKGGMKIEKVY